jgi:hypothetical protein
MVEGVSGCGVEVVGEGGRGPPLVVTHLRGVVGESRLVAHGVTISWIVDVTVSAES